MTDKTKVKLLILLLLSWGVVFSIRVTYFKTEQRRVPLKYKNTPEDVTETKAKSDKLNLELPVLLSGEKVKNNEIKLSEVKNVFAPLRFYIPPPPPRPEPPPPPPPPKLPEPHPLEKTLQELDFMGKATKYDKVMVFLTYREEVFYVTKGSIFMDGKLTVSGLGSDSLIVRIKDTDITREINFQ